MTTSMNPIVYLQHAWDKTHSMWGKMTIVLFYVYIWLSIIMSFITMVWPSWMGCDCFWKKESEFVSFSTVNLVRVANLFAISFFLYADRGGIRLWNVTMVFVVTVIYSWLTWTWAKKWAMMEGAPKHCDDQGTTTMLIVGVVWIVFAWIFSLMEHKAMRAASGGSSGDTTNESTPLTS